MLLNLEDRLSCCSPKPAASPSFTTFCRSAQTGRPVSAKGHPSVSCLPGGWQPPEKAAGQSDIPGRRLHLNHIGQGEDQSGVRGLSAVATKTMPSTPTGDSAGKRGVMRALIEKFFNYLKLIVLQKIQASRAGDATIQVTDKLRCPCNGDGGSREAEMQRVGARLARGQGVCSGA